MVESSKLNQLLFQNLDRIIQELLPGGKQRGHEYVCGNCFGGAGTSFSLNLSKGIWSDFASADKGGDLISLFIARADGNKRTGLRDVYNFLGLKQSPDKTVYSKPKKKFTSPTQDWMELDGEVYTYLVKERGISDEALSKYEVSMCFDRPGGPHYTFIYKSQSGNVTYLAKYVSVHRTEEGKKIITAQSNGLLVLYGMHAVPRTEEEIVITSGELDALSYASQGITAVSIPNGDKNLQWIENSWDFLTQFKTIYISFDMDDSGAEMVDSVAARLGVERCKRVLLPLKDANECLLNELELGRFIEEAQDITPIGFVLSSDLLDGVWSEITKGPRSEQGIPFLGWTGDETVNFRIRPHEVTVYLGMEFSGKSTLMYQLAAYLAGIHGEKVAIASLEENPEAVLSVMLSQWLAYPLDNLDYETYSAIFQKTIAENIFIYNDRTAEAPIKNLLDFADYCVKRYGVQHVCIDSLTCTSMNVEDNEEANAFMKQLIKCCNTTKAHFHIVAHSKKGSHDEFDRASIPKKRDIKGSVTIPALATNIVAIWRNSSKQAILDNKRQSKYRPEDVIRWADAVLAVRKNKVGGTVGEFDLFFDPKTSRFRRIQSSIDKAYIPNPDTHPF